MRKGIVERTAAGAFIVALACALAAFGTSPAYAQADAPSLFSYVTTTTAMSAEQQDQVAAYEADPTTAEIAIVSINPEALRTADAMTLNIQGAVGVVLDSVRIEERGPNDFSWFASPSGSGPVPETEAILVVDGTDVVGTVRVGGELFKIRPVGANQALILVDQSAFPEEHPPEFETLEQQSAAQPLSLTPDELADTCPEFTAIVGYTPAAKAEAGNIDALIQLAVDETNQGYVNGQVNTKLKLVHKYQTTYTESADMALDRDRFRIPGDGFMDEVHGLRDSNFADIGVLITKSGNYCGIAAAILADQSTAFAVVGQNCATGYYSFAHEIGHLQGARHNPEADPSSSPFAYGHGIFNIPGGWRTVMSYACGGGSCNRLNFWSNPAVLQGGVPMGTATLNDNHRVLNETSCTIAGFRGVPPPPSSSSGPLAFGVVWSDGTKMSGTPNWTSSYNSTYKRYEITITGESYYYTKYSTAVTPAGDTGYCRTDSVGGKLLISCSDHTGAGVASRIGFVTYKK